MHFIKVTSVLWEWREAIEPKKMVDLLHEGGSRAFQGKWSVLSSPDCAVRPNATGWGWQSGKTFQMQALAIKPFCFVNCSQGGRGLQAPTSVHKYLISSHVYGLGAALLSLGEVPSEAVTCCLVLLNNNQVFSSFFLFSFFLLKLPLLWPSAFPPHIQSLLICVWTLFPRSLSGFGEDLLGYLLLSYIFLRWTVANVRYHREKIKTLLMLPLSLEEKKNCFKPLLMSSFFTFPCCPLCFPKGTASQVMQVWGRCSSWLKMVYLGQAYVSQSPHLLSECVFQCQIQRMAWRSGGGVCGCLFLVTCL